MSSVQLSHLPSRSTQLLETTRMKIDIILRRVPWMRFVYISQLILLYIDLRNNTVGRGNPAPTKVQFRQGRRELARTKIQHRRAGRPRPYEGII